MITDFHPGYLINAIVFAVLGVGLFLAGFSLLVRAAPCELWKELVEKQNLAVAVFMGAATLALGIVIAATVH